MKRLLFILLCLPLALFSQEDNQPNLFETVGIHVKPGQDKAFEAAVKAHNMKFHAEGTAYRARLFYNINGPLGGTYSWIMGPMNWASYEGRPGEGAHDDDWDTNVDPLVEKYEVPNYWTYSAKLSHSIEGQSPQNRLLWVYDLIPGQGSRWSELVEKVKAVYAAKRPTEQFWVVWNEFADTKLGMDVALIFPFDDWAWMDRDSNFGKLYEEVHGEGTWHNFLNDFNATVQGRVDWLRRRID